MNCNSGQAPGIKLRVCPRLAAHHQDAIRARAAIPVAADRPDAALETLLTVLPAWENAAQP